MGEESIGKHLAALGERYPRKQRELLMISLHLCCWPWRNLGECEHQLDKRARLYVSK